MIAWEQAAIELSSRVASPGFQARSQDDRAAFYMAASCKPDNIDRVKTAIREELDRLLKDGITEQELAAAKQGYLQRQNVSRTNDAQLASVLTSTSQAGRTMKHYAELEKRMRQAVQSAPADDPREQLVALFLAYVDFARNNPELYLLYSHPKLLDYSSEPFREARAELGEILDTLLENACKAGWLARDDLAAARYSSMAMLRGYAGVITGGVSREASRVD